MLIVDGTNMVLGRLASKIAKEIIKGEEVHLINAEKIIISGSPSNIIENYLQRRRLQNKANPERSPKWPKVPHMLVKRIIRGMLPFKKAKGKKAFKKLKVYTGDPGIKGEIKIFEDAKSRGFKKYITIEELCKHLGWKR